MRTRPLPDPYDEALDRIVELTSRLHAVADLHRPRRTLLRGVICAACSAPHPCPTSRATGDAPPNRGEGAA